MAEAEAGQPGDRRHPARPRHLRHGRARQLQPPQLRAATRNLHTALSPACDAVSGYLAEYCTGLLECEEVEIQGDCLHSCDHFAQDARIYAAQVD